MKSNLEKAKFRRTCLKIGIVIFCYCFPPAKPKELFSKKANLRDLIAATGIIVLIWWMTSKNNRAPLLYYINLCASFQSHGWIQTGVTVRKRSIRVKLAIFCPMWPWNLTDDLEKNRAPLLYCFKHCASFHSHQWIQTEVTVRKPTIRVKIGIFLAVWPWNLTDDLEKQ